jgi:hypothetical protein
MAITTEKNRMAEASTDGVVTDFDFDLLIHAASELQVWYVWYKVTDGGYGLLTLNTDYGVTFTEAGGTVSTDGFRAPLAAGTLLIIRHLDITQQTNWLYNDNHTGQQHQDDFDRAVMRDLQIQDVLDRVVTLAIHSSTTGIILPEPDANMILGWNAAGTNLANISPSALAVLISEEIELGDVPENLTDLSDVTIASPVANDVLRYIGGMWCNKPAGISDDDMLEVDGSPNSGEYARFTVNGLEGRTEAEFKADFNLEIGTDVQAYDAGLTSLAGLTYAAKSFVQMTAANTFALRTLAETSDDLEGTIEHDNLSGFVANEHIDWTGTSEDFSTSGMLGAGAITGTSFLIEAATRPTLRILDTGNPSIRLFPAVAGERLDLSCNANYTGAQWNRDDEGETAAMITMAVGIMYFYVAGAAANPIAWTTALSIANDGDIYTDRWLESPLTQSYQKAGKILPLVIRRVILIQRVIITLFLALRRAITIQQAMEIPPSVRRHFIIMKVLQM